MIKHDTKLEKILLSMLHEKGALTAGEMIKNIRNYVEPKELVNITATKFNRSITNLLIWGAIEKEHVSSSRVKYKITVFGLKLLQEMTKQDVFNDNKGDLNETSDGHQAK